MPRVAKKLSAIELTRLGPGIHAVGGVAGLLLQVSEASGRSWLLRTVVGTKRREIGLGPYPEIGLAVARQKAGEIKEQIRNGIDPVEQRKANRAEIIASQKAWLIVFASSGPVHPPQDGRTERGEVSRIVAG